MVASCTLTRRQTMTESFVNDDARLLARVEKIKKDRVRLGLVGMTGGLEFVIIRTEPDNHLAAARELLDRTGLDFDCAFRLGGEDSILLTRAGSPDFLLVGGSSGANPFRPHNLNPKSASLPNTRLETFVYLCDDVKRYAAIQKKRGIRFLTVDPVETEIYTFIQTEPSPYTGNSTGFVQWKSGLRRYRHSDTEEMNLELSKPEKPHLSNIFELDHTATRVRAQERDDAIVEFMRLTDYDYDFSVYVESLNSITNVARLSPEDYAQVFTSGIAPFKSLEESGPTERFIHNYGLRVHHMAFRTEDIDATFQALKQDGMDFLVELVGSREDGLKQTFSQMSPNTLLVNEYIHRYDGFDGFFTRSNVTELTRATEKQ